MDMFFGFAILVGVFVGVLIATIVVLVVHIRTNGQINKMTFPAYEYAVKKAEHESSELIKEAQKKAREIIVQAEQSGQQAIQQYDESAKEIQLEYKSALERQTKEMTDMFDQIAAEQSEKVNEVVGSIKASFADEHKKVVENVMRINGSLEAVATRTEQQAKENLAALEERINGIGEDIAASLRNSEKTGVEQIDKHFKDLHQQIEKEFIAYGDNRKRILDTNIEKLVEEVVKQVLHTDLPVSVHASLARQALEEAKSKNIL